MTLKTIRSMRLHKIILILCIGLLFWLTFWVDVFGVADDTVDISMAVPNAQGIVYLCDSCPILSDIAGTEKGISLNSGSTVRLLSVSKSGEKLWYKVSYAIDDVEYEGFICRDYLAVTNEEVLKIEDSLCINGYQTRTRASVLREDAVTADVATFPVTYQSALMELKRAHPNWVFVAQNTGLDWNTVITNEVIAPRSLVSASKSSAWGTDKYSNSWKIASRKAVEYCMDPRNYLSEQLIFAFEQLTYNASYHSVEATQAIINNTFMSGELPLSGMTYAQAFFSIGSELGVSPYHLASRVAQEQGKGTSPLISGNYPNFEGYYNYFNVSASGATNEAIYTSGLSYAKRKGWDTPYKSIEGGAKVISANYILKGQDTLYLEKYDVDNSYSGMYTHQYMQNILAPRSEATITYRGYNSAGAVNNSFAFKIPVYSNMPDSICPDPDKPTESPTSPAISPQPVPTSIVPSVGFNEAEVSKFVSRLYNLVLGREAEEAGLKNWVNSLKYHQTDGSSTALGFFESKEMKDRKLSNEEYVKICYRTMLGREADEAGLKDWSKKLEDGMSRIYVLSGFTNSVEYSELCKKYGIKSGQLSSLEPRDINQGITGFIARCYQQVLGRQYDENGLNDWTLQINNSLFKKTRAEQIASDGFFHSQEFISKNTTDEEYVKILYRTFLGREYDREGYIDWLVQLKTHKKNRDEVLYGFSRSTEFSKIMESYGIW